MIRTVMVGLLFAAACLATLKPGEYQGSYTSSSAGSGTFHTSFKLNDDSSWTCQFAFIYDGEEIVGKNASCSIEGDKITAQYDADVQGTAAHTQMTGEVVEGNQLQGRYVTKDDDGSVVSEGSWKASLRP